MPLEERFLDFVYQPRREADGTISGIIALGVDVTESKRAELALMQTEKLAAVGRLASSIAHEINNPLESVTNLLYLARETAISTQTREYLTLADRELRRVSVIANQTLRFHKQSSRPQSITCEDLIGSAISVYQGRLVNSSVEVERRKRAVHPVLCFEGEIRQVLSNLIINAIDAMHPHGGRLLMRSREGTDWRTERKGLILTVADTGSGMSPDIAPKIFEPFFTTKEIGGTGLGLWVSHEIVQRHGGVLAVRSSQRKGRSGTVFTLFLPFDAVVR
jgi:signal transduction histidine kinase